MDGLAILLDKDCRGLQRPTRNRLSYQPASPPLHHLPSILRSARSNSQSDRGRRGRGPCPYPSASDRTNIRVFAPRRNPLHFEKYRRGRYSSRCRGSQSDSKALARHCAACCHICSSFFAVSQRLPSGAANPTNLLIVTFIASFFLDLILLYTAFFIGVGRYAQALYQNALFVPLSRGLGLVLAYYGIGFLGIAPLRVLGIATGWAVGGIATLLLSVYLWHGQLPRGASYPIRPILAFSLPVFISALITLDSNGVTWASSIFCSGQLFSDLTIL